MPPELVPILIQLGGPILIGWMIEQGIIPPWVGDVLGMSTDQAVESERLLIEQTVDATKQEVTSSDHGLNAIMTQVRRFNVDNSKLLQAVQNMQTQISNLPSAPSEDSIAAQVWGYPNVGEDIPAYQHLLLLERFAHNIDRLVEFPHKDDPFLLVRTGWKYPPD